MSGMINIGGNSVGDVKYRYRMPSLLTKIEGRGNGIKTILTNIEDVAHALHVHPSYPTKFFALQLGAVSSYDVKTMRAVVNGAHANHDLSRLLAKYIDQFVICTKCRYPELFTKVRKKTGFVEQVCVSCGHSRTLDPNHKLVKHMATTQLFVDPPAGKPQKSTLAKQADLAKKQIEKKQETVDEKTEMTATATVMVEAKLTAEELLKVALEKDEVQQSVDYCQTIGELRRQALVRDFTPLQSATLLLQLCKVQPTNRADKLLQAVLKNGKICDKPNLLLAASNLKLNAFVDALLDG